MLVFLNTAFHVYEIEQVRVSLLPELSPFPYSLDKIVSESVKISSVTNENKRRTNEFDQFVRDMRFHLQNCNQLTVDRLISTIASFVQFLAVKCLENGWYNDDGESPWRFTDWRDGTMDIMLATPER